MTDDTTTRPEQLEQPAPGPRPAAAASLLANLRQRREKAVSELYTDLPVPRYDPPIYVRFKAIPDGRLKQIDKRFGKSKASDKDVVANCVALAEACVGVFELDQDGERVSIDLDDRDGEWPKFDERLGKLLGMEFVPGATEVMRELYLTDGDILSTAAKVAEWSGYTLDQLDELQGN